MKRLAKLTRRLSPERQMEVLEELAQTSSPGFDYYLLVILSCTIATFGLITNSVAVIIGAMLVAPLMSPILGLSIASVAGDRQLFERAVIALFRGVILAIALSAALSWVAQMLPFDALKEIPSEVLSRTHPSPYDLVIALAGGAAAAYALAQPQLSAALPGVAIATALMPPLCTVGIGIHKAILRLPWVHRCFISPTLRRSHLQASERLLYSVFGRRISRIDGMACRVVCLSPLHWSC